MRYFEKIRYAAMAVFWRCSAAAPRIALRGRCDRECPPGRRFVHELSKLLIQLVNRE